METGRLSSNIFPLPCLARPRNLTFSHFFHCRSSKSQRHLNNPSGYRQPPLSSPRLPRRACHLRRNRFLGSLFLYLLRKIQGFGSCDGRVCFWCRSPGKNIIDAADEVAKEEGSVLERFVFSTLPGFKEQSKGKYTYAYHFDSKAVITEYLKEKELWEKSSLLNMGFYTDNMIKYGSITGAAKVRISVFPLGSIADE